MLDSILQAWCLSLRACIDAKREFIHNLSATAKLISYLLTYSDLCSCKVEFTLTTIFLFKTLPSAE